MNELKYAVLFDTNSYRNLVSNKSTEETKRAIEELRAAEDKKNIKAFGVVIVGMEMLGNLVEDENGINYKDCLNGIIAFANHCYDEEQKAPRIIPQPYMHLCRSFFNVIPQEMEEKVKNLGGTFNDFRLDLNKALTHHKSVNTFENTKKFIAKEEENFANQIIELINGARNEILKQHPKITKKQLRLKLLDFIENGSFEPFMALAIMVAVANKINIQLSQDEIIKRAYSMHLNFPLSVGFYKWICSKIVSDNIDMMSKTSKEKRWNWQWDYQISFAVSNSTIDNREVILITSDKDVIEMLKEHGFQNKVLTITEYLNFLK